MATLTGTPGPDLAVRPSRDSGRAADGSRQPWYTSALARIVMIALCLLFLLPLFWMVSSSLKTNQEMATYPPAWWPARPQFSNYADAVRTFPFWRMFANSAIITVATVVFSVVSNFLVAYGFACVEWIGRNKVFYVVLATLFLPFPVTLIPMFDLYAKLGWVNTFLPLIVPHLFASAFYTFLLRQFLLQVPKDMLDAARVDGAGEWKIAWTLVFPSALPAITAVAIFSAVAAWNDFLGPLIYLQDTRVQTLSIGLQYFRETQTEDLQYNQLMAASFLVVLPLIVLFFVFQRYFLRGISLGGFK
ncbi:multiple sugar transport system permease protein [Friedmanniella endophytica]|uniref:Multiple sugar transport system permease protein n=1 Tax=Microlunatus kandeliicorticis TaxID=1759536 RepID=A0A7W3IPD9_9ACTN|nr:carbohydrate ABC transporter permease [Microlunatus kandeliicorticis]MBA8792798.1 multiple sugar transport system permease protein [Microlunatus kandeliicorticis]